MLQNRARILVVTFGTRRDNGCAEYEPHTAYARRNIAVAGRRGTSFARRGPQYQQSIHHN